MLSGFEPESDMGNVNPVQKIILIMVYRLITFFRI